jgi:hypothetical protein
MSLVQRLATAVVAKLVKRKGLEKLADDTPFLDFLTDLFTQLLPVLIGCFGAAGAAGELRSMGALTRVRLRLAIRRELGDRESVRLFADPIFDACLEVGATVKDREVTDYAAEAGIAA